MNPDSPASASGHSALRRWVSASVALGIVVIGLLSWLYYEQRQTFQTASRQLAELRQARIELAKGFLQASLAEGSDPTFSRNDGLALLGQSVHSFERAIATLGVVDSADIEAFRRSVEAFRILLAQWRRSPVSDIRSSVALRIAFADLERRARRVDAAGQRQLEIFSNRSDRTYAWSLAGSLLALSFIIAIIVRIARRERLAITAQLQLDRAHRISEERFRRLFDEAPAPLSFVNQDGVLLDRNRRFDATFGYDHEELQSLDDWWRLAFPDASYRAWAQATWNAATAHAAGAGSDLTPGEYTVSCKDGSQRVMLISGITLGQDVLAMFYDITEQSRAAQAQARMLQVLEEARAAAHQQMEEAQHARAEAERQRAALRESRERMQLLIDHAPAALALFDRDMRYLAVSRRWLEDYGLVEQPILGVSHYAVFPEIGENLKAIHRRCLAGEILHADEDRFPRADGRVHWLRWEVRPWFEQDGAIGGIVIFTEDITRLHQVREEVFRLNADLERRVAERTAELSAANQELESFAYAVSHDLRAPLRAMSGFSQALEEDYGDQLSGGARTWLEQIRIASRNMNNLIDGILTLSRSTRGELRRDPVDLSEMARCQLAQLAQPERPLAVEVAAGLMTRGDARMLEAVLANLLGNAWKYTGRTAAPQIRVYAEDRADGRWFCVADNGAGFDMAHADRLFKPFQRLHRQEEFPGIGIGLATVKRIIQRHGGKIEARGEVGQGATFCFRLGAEEGTQT